jgi:hypothetical protein
MSATQGVCAAASRLFGMPVATIMGAGSGL